MAGAAPRLDGGPAIPRPDSRSINCPSAVFESIRQVVLERFNQLPHGGAEVFGVLFGRREGDDLHIQAFRALPAGSAFDRSAEFSPAERTAFQTLVALIQSAEDLAGLEPVGWFRSHPRSDLVLSPHDLEITTSLFSEPWQVAMVLRPGNSTPTHGRVYFRDADGALHPDRAFQELTLPAAADFSSPATKLPATYEPAHAEAEQPVEAAVQGKAEESPAPPKSRWRTAVWPLLMFAGFCAVGALYWFTRPPKQLALRLLDTGGQLNISWNRTATAVQKAEAAHLEVTDGNARLWFDLDHDQLSNGNVTYTRRSNNVAVRLVVQRTNMPPVEEVARFFGMPGELPSPPVASQNQPPDTGSRGREAPPVERLAAPPRRTELVVPVPVARAPQVATPPPNVEVARKDKPAVPDLGSPPQISHETPAGAPPAQVLRAEPQPEKQAPLPGVPSLTSPAPAPAPENPVRPAAPARAPAVPASGRVVWIGRLQKNQALTISGKTASTGTIIGELPGKPVRLIVSPGDLSNDGIVLYTANAQYANNVVEPPGAQNGWNKTTYTWNPRLANDVIIQEPPAQQNEWNRIVLRSKNPKLSVIVIDWALAN